MVFMIWSMPPASDDCLSEIDRVAEVCAIAERE